MNHNELSAPVEQLAARLVGELAPVAQVTARRAWLAVVATLMVVVAAVAAAIGLRPDIVDGRPSRLLVARSAALIAVAVTSFTGLLRIGLPGRGRSTRWWAAAALIGAGFPAVSLVSALRRDMPAEVWSLTGLECLLVSSAAAAAIGALLVRWLRSAAPTDLAGASWLAGAAAGAFGTFAYNLHCPTSTVEYAGIWYAGSVVFSAVIGRLTVPRWIRW